MPQKDGGAKKGVSGKGSARTPSGERSTALTRAEQRALREEKEQRELLLGEDGSALSAGIGTGKKEKSRKPKVRTVRARTRKRLPMSSVFFMMVCTLLLMFMIINYVQINEYTQEVTALKREMTTLENERTDLELELEKKNDLSLIEARARELGMMGSEDLQKVVVRSQKEDTVESYDTEEEDLGILTTLLSALGQNWRVTWNIFGLGE